MYLVVYAPERLIHAVSRVSLRNSPRVIFFFAGERETPSVFAKVERRMSSRFFTSFLQIEVKFGKSTF